MRMAPASSRGLTDIIPSLVVTFASLALLVFVAYGEASRAYSQLRIERIAALGATLELSVERFASTGLALTEFTGFDQRARTIVPIDEAIEAVMLLDRNGALVESAVSATLEGRSRSRLEADLPRLGTELGLAPESRIDVPLARLVELGERFGLFFAIDSKFETIGSLLIVVDRRAVIDPIEVEFRDVARVSLIIFAVFALYQVVGAFNPRFGGRSLMTTAFACAFFATAGVTTSGLFELYAEGVQNKIKGIAESISERLSVATSLGVDPRDLRGVQELLVRYVEENDDVSEVALVSDGTIVVHNDLERVGDAHDGGDDTYTVLEPLQPVAGDDRVMLASVSVPISVVAERIWRQAKDFAVLFLATGLIAWHFLSIGHRFESAKGRMPLPPTSASGRIRYRRTEAQLARSERPESGGEMALIRPAYFLAIFADALLISFLPSLSGDLASQSGYPASLGSLPFTIFFLGLTSVLIPATAIAERGQLKTLFLTGACLVALSFLALAVTQDFLVLVLARGVAGVGQGMLTVGMQSYGVALVPPERRTEAMAVQVQAYNAGVISGAAIGGLLVDLTQEQGVFWVALSVALATSVYVILVLHNPESVAKPAAVQQPKAPRGQLAGDLLASLKDFEFLKILFLVGMISKLILAGIVFFAAPLVLRQQGYDPDAVGQIVMFAAIGTLVSATLFARLVDRFKGARRLFLTLGGTISGAGVLLFSFAGLSGVVEAIGSAGTATLAAIVGLLLVGVAQALVVAPAVTQVANTPVARTRGQLRIAGLYRLLERLGQISGPPLIAAMLGLVGGSPVALAVVGGVTVALSACYLLMARSEQSEQPQQARSRPAS